VAVRFLTLAAKVAVRFLTLAAEFLMDFKFVLISVQLTTKETLLVFIFINLKETRVFRKVLD
jgi:hypothetical protein